MKRPAATASLPPTEDAAAGLLAAERAALAGVESCRRQALQLVAASWLRAALVHKRTEARIRRLRERMTAAAQARQRRIGRDIDSLASDPAADESMLAVLDRATARLAEELAGGPASG